MKEKRTVLKYTLDLRLLSICSNESSSRFKNLDFFEMYSERFDPAPPPSRENNVSYPYTEGDTEREREKGSTIHIH